MSTDNVSHQVRYTSTSHHRASESNGLPKDPRSKAKYNLISRVFFCWLEPLFFLGLQRTLHHSDLYAHPPEADSEKLLTNFNRYWNEEVERKRRGAKPRLWVAILKCVWVSLFLQAVGFLVLNVVLLSQPINLGYIIEYFSIDDPSGEETRNVYLFAAGLVAAGLFVTVINTHVFLLAAQIGMAMRVTLTAAIYQKILKLSQITISQKSTGHIINLASNDVQRFDLMWQFHNYFWIGPLQYLIGTVLIYNEVGWSAFLILGYLIIQVLLEGCLIKLYSVLRFKSAKITDQRVKVMNEVITGIRVIKMYAWEYAFKKVISKLRRNEAAIILQAFIVQGLTMAVIYIAPYYFILFLIFTPFVLTGGELTAKSVFTVLSLVDLLRLSLFLCTHGLLDISEGFVGISRIQKLLEWDEIGKRTDEIELPSVRVALSLASSSDVSTATRSLPKEEQPCSFIKVSKLCASWSYEREKLVLEDINFTVLNSSHFSAVVGPLASGKCLLGELQSLEGSVEVCGKVSYCSQEPWVFSGSLRENILFGLPYQRDWYTDVVEACALDQDISQLIDGDLTLVGERGVTLSGGQKARVTLARAVYRSADIYLLDDPLSAVDSAVARHLFRRVICGLLSDKLVVLVTHQVHYALQASSILALRNGKVEQFGSPEDLMLRGVEPSRLLGLKNTEEDDFSIQDEVEEEHEGACSGHLDHSVVARCDNERNLDTQRFNNFGLHAGSMWSLHSDASSKVPQDQSEGQVTFLPSEEKAVGSISLKTYYRYLRAGGNHMFLFTVLLMVLVSQGTIVLTDWWIADWAECSDDGSSSEHWRNESDTQGSTCQLSANDRIGIYTGIMIATVFIYFLMTILFHFLMVNASRVWHNRMFASILRAPIRFFDTNPSGRVLNRFSKDVGFLDDLLSATFYTFVVFLVRVIVIFVTACIANYWVILPAAALIVLFAIVTWYYLRTAREVKRLEAIARSPLYSHISATLHGLSTIRTFGEQSVALKHFHKLQNEHTQGWYLYLVTARWLGIRIDTIGALLVAAVAFTSIPLASSLNAGLVGLGLLYSMTLTDLFQFVVRLGTDVENLMISAERVIQYSEVESEAPLETQSDLEKPPSYWPNQGAIVMEAVSFRYDDKLPFVLNDLSLSIAQSEKVGIVGRTGAGKSSLISVLFRMAEPHGVVRVDGITTTSIGLHDLRRNISIIPQDPVLFSGTMRYNLDPFNRYSDEALWDALDQVQLKNTLNSLYEEVSERGTNFSVGQKQLVCLARALLRKNRIIVLDEATANVDLRTDQIIQETIRKQFSDCTVLTIAHRLNTIVDSDRILVMDKGQVKEFDSPYRLLQNHNSHFRRMVEQTGLTASKKLHRMAVEAFERRRNLCSHHLNVTPNCDSDDCYASHVLVTPL